MGQGTELGRVEEDGDGWAGWLIHAMGMIRGYTGEMGGLSLVEVT